MSDDERTLLDLNRVTFAAEQHKPAKSWADVLHKALTDDFRLRRGIGEIEDRERMIARLSRTKPVPREILEATVAVQEETAVVRSRVRMGGNTFRNAKLFEKTSDGWRCAYWRVTREAAD
jgi:hypothetical protein